MVTWVRGDHSDPFYPHSFFNHFEHPAEGVEELYAISSMPLKGRLRLAISSMLGVCRPGCPDYALLAPEARFVLLKATTRLITTLLIFDASDRIACIGTDDADYWRQCSLDEEVFAVTTNCLGTLALERLQSSFWRTQYTDDLEAALYRLIASELFVPRYSPYVVAALISLSPNHLVDHLHALGAQIALLHRQEPGQIELAQLTAKRVVNKAPLQLYRKFEDLDFRYPSSRDRWLLDALFSADGPLALTRDTVKADRPLVFAKSRPNVRTRLKHEHWAFYSPESTVAPPAPEQGSPKVEALQKYPSMSRTFFHAEPPVASRAKQHHQPSFDLSQ